MKLLSLIGVLAHRYASFSIIMLLFVLPTKALCAVGDRFNDENGLYYQVVSESEVSVTYPDAAEPWGWTDVGGIAYYSGNIVVPSSVVYESKAYTVVSVGKLAFDKCTELLSLKLPNTITTLEKQAISRCSKLTSLELPNSIVSIGYKALQQNAFKSISLPNGVKSIGDGAFYGAAIDYITIPESVTSFGDAVFANCSSLKEVDFQGQISVFNGYMFQNCSSLEKVSVPSSVTTIKNQAFRGCENIEKILVNNKDAIVTIESGAFTTTVYNNAILYVPTGKVADYQASSGFASDHITDESVVAVSVWPSPFGVASLTGADFYQGGDEFTVTATATDDKYIFSEWEYPSDLTVKEENGSSITFTLTAEAASKYAASGIDIFAKFEKKTVQLILSYDEEQGIMTGANSGDKFEVGSTLTLTAVAEAGYHFYKFVNEKGLELPSDKLTASVATTTIEFPVDATSVTVEAVFEANPQHNVSLTINDDALGHVTGYRSSGIYNEGQTIALTAVANEHCKFVNWKYDGNTVTSEELVIEDIAKNYAIVATFQEDPKSTLTIGVKDNIAGCSVGFVNSSYSNPQSLYVGQTAAIIANDAPQHYHFVKWIDSKTNATVSDQKTFVVTYTSENKSYLAVYEEDPTYSITVKTDLAAASNLVTTTYNNLYKADQKVLSFTVNTGYEFVSWEYGETGSSTTSTSKDESQTVTVVDKNLTYTAHFQKKEYSITTSATNGTIVLSAAKSVMGEKITVTAVPNEGYEVVLPLTTNVAGTNIVNGEFTMPASDIIVAATFRKKDYTITTGSTVNGTISAPAKAQLGDEVTVNVSPADGYELVEVTTTPSVLVSGNKFNMPASDITVNATFKKTDYTITKGDMTNGTVSVQSSANKGDVVQMVVSPATGYVLDVLSTTPALAITDNQFTMPSSNVVVNATFKLKDYSISKTSTTNGSYEVQSTAKMGDNVIVTVTPAAGYELDKIETTPALLVASNQFTMPASDVTVVVTFKKTDYTITKGETTNGTISVQSSANAGDVVSVGVVPAEGYVLNVLSTVPALDINEDYEFTMPSSNVTVNATFKKADFTITKSNTVNGTIDVQSTAQMGDNVTVTVTPATGYELDALSATPSIGFVGNTFTMPAKDVVISATFKPIGYKVTTVTPTNGTLTVTPTDAVIGTEVTVTATPDEGFELGSVTTNYPGLTVVNGKFTMPASDVEVSATFNELKYHIGIGDEGGAMFSDTYVPKGTEVTITPLVDPGYEVDQITTNVPGVNVVDGKLIMPACDVLVNITYKLKEFNVTLVTPENGTLSVSSTKAVMGTEITVYTTPSAGYKNGVISSDVDGLEITDNKFTMPASDVTISATFIEESRFNITTAKEGEGTITVSTDNAEEGAVITVSADAAEGYTFGSLSTNVDGLTISADGKFTMPGRDVEVKAVFNAIEYDVTTAATTNGSVSTDVSKAIKGDEVEITITPDAGYELESLSTDPQLLLTADNKFTMPAGNVEVSATFKLKEYSISLGSCDHGNVYLSSTKSVMNEEITVTAQPATGYKLASLTTDVEGVVITDGKFTMPASDVVVTAVFVEEEAVEYNITVAATENGSVTVSAEKAAAGSQINVVPTPADGYELETLTTNVQGVYVVEGILIMPESDVTITATFKKSSSSEEKTEYNIVAANAENGTLTVSVAKAEAGTEVSVVAKAAEGYELDTLTTNVEGLEIKDGKFTMPAKDVTITATFKKIVEPVVEYAIVAKEAVNGTLTVSVAKAVAGAEVSVVATAAAGYELESLTTDVEGLEVKEGKFTMPAKDVTVTATFKAVEHTVSVAEVANGAVKVSAEKAIIGTEISVEATAAEGYELETLTTNVEGLEIKDGKFVMPASDVTVTAKFKAIQYAITVTATVNGKVTVSSETATIGTEVKVVVTPDANYELETLTVDGTEIAGDTFTMPAKAVTVNATFKVACEACKSKVKVAQVFDWILVVDNKSLKASGIDVTDADIAWYRVVDGADEWCQGAQEVIGGADEKIGTGFYFADENQSLVSTGDYYAVVTLKDNICKYITSEVISYSASNKMLLTPTSVKHGQTLTLTGLPSIDAVINVYDVSGTLVKTIKSDGNSTVTFEAESVNGIYIVNVVADRFTKSIKYIVK